MPKHPHDGRAGTPVGERKTMRLLIDGDLLASANGE